jgi:hypothetical protein
MGTRSFKLKVANQPLAASWVWQSVAAGFVPGSTGPTIGADGTYEIGGVVYSESIGPRGPMFVMIAAFNQADVGYCYETNNVAENLPAKWASRGIKAYKIGHPNSVLQGRSDELLAALEAAGLGLIALPQAESEYGFSGDLSLLDYRDLAINDPYWREKWFYYQILDEPDLGTVPLSRHLEYIPNSVIGGLRKPFVANFTRRVAVPSQAGESSNLIWKPAFDATGLSLLAIDSYEWHLTANQSNSATVTKSSPDTWISTWHGEGIYNSALSPPLDTATRLMFGRRFTASVTGMAVHLQRNGPLSRGRSTDGGVTILPPGGGTGVFVLPSAMAYAPGDKAGGHFIATGRVEINSASYPQSGRWQPGRYLRSEAWSGFVHGSSSLYIFPQTTGNTTVTGYIDATANTLVVTSEPSRPFLFGGALRLQTEGDFTVKGWVRRDSPQLSGTPGGAGTYALDTGKATPIATGTSGSPVTIQVSTEGRPWGDDSNPENLAELAAVIDNLDRMQAHPTGGNLMIDTSQGGRRAFSVMRCPDINADTSLYKEDMTLAPIQAGYTSGGAAIADSGGGLPLWDFGWPMGFEGFRVTGDDGALYIYVRAMSNAKPTWFPGYAALGLPERVFGPLEFAGFRRVGTGTAVEMTGTSGVIKAGVDDGAPTWFYIETLAITQNEGNSGNTAYAITVRRGGDLSGTDTVTATVSGTGSNPANAADFGGSFPSQVLSFAPTEATKVFTVNVSGDTTGEQNETFAVTLSSPSTDTALVGSNKSAITCTITNDDAALLGTFVWLGSTLTAAPALSGSPAGATYLNASETTNVTRGGITMRSVSSGPPVSDNTGFASTPFWQIGNSFQGARFEIPAGNWEFAFIATAAFGGISGTVTIRDLTASVDRQTVVLSSAAGALLLDTAENEYTTSSTAVADAVGAPLPYLPVTVADAGSGTGVIQLYANGVNISAIALRQL